MPNSAVVLHDSQNRQDNKTSCGMELLAHENEDDDDGKLYEFSKIFRPIRELMQASASYLTMLLPHYKTFTVRGKKWKLNSRTLKLR